MKSVFFHYSLDAGESTVEFLLGVEFSKLQAGSARELSRRRIVGDAFNRHYAHEKIGDGQKTQPDAGGVGAIGLRLNVCESSGGKEGLHRVVQGFTRERFADPERRGRQQRCLFFPRNPRQFDFVDR